MYDDLEREAAAAGLPLQWPLRVPYTRRALAVVDWTRRAQPGHFHPLQESLFAAHFVLGENLGDPDVVDRHAAAADVDLSRLHKAVQNGTALAALADSKEPGRIVGVSGTPTWLIGDELVSGLLPDAVFLRLAAELGQS